MVASFKFEILLLVYYYQCIICLEIDGDSKGTNTKYIYYLLVTTLRPASPGFATWRIGGFGDFCHFGDFDNFLAIFLAHFDPWTICDNYLQ